MIELINKSLGSVTRTGLLIAAFFVLGCEGDSAPQGGSVGPQGEDGEQGPQGPDGADGAPGANGAQGPAGEQGPQGPVGANGAQGVQGAQGPDGADGAQGAQGPAGADGADGVAGPAGADGADGAPQSKGDLYVVTDSIVVPANLSAEILALCADTNDVVLHGSCSNAFQQHTLANQAWFPVDGAQQSGWRCFGQNLASGTFTLIARATCIAIP